ncbi:MAG: cytochrome ubiquinol oxidase subunit I, partial [Nitrospiraceae bacterium]
MGGLTRNKTLSILALGAMIGLLLLPIVVSMPALAGGGGTPAAGGPPPDVAKKADTPEAAKVEKGRDVFYKTEGIVSGAPAPKTADNPQFYPRYNFESRVLLWFANQQHLYYGSFVLAVPIFCMIIEFMGIVSKDKAMAKKYDQLAYDFIKISLTAYSL